MRLFIQKRIAIASHPLSIVFLLAALVFLCKFPALSVPYYWDEMNWSKGAYWLSETNILRAIPGFHPPETFAGRPPALPVTLAILFKMFGQSISTAHLLILCFAVLGVGATYLLGRHLYDAATGFFSALFLFLSPLYLAQSGMFLADLPVASLGVLCIYLALQNKYVSYLVCASFLVFIKETAVLLIIPLLLYFCVKTPPLTKEAWIRLLKYSVPLFEIAVFFVWQKFTTGHFSATYDPYALSQLESRFGYQALIISKWLFVYQGRYFFSALIALNFIFNKTARRCEASWLFLLILLFFYAFVFIYPYFLPRYLLPALPYFYLLGGWALMEPLKATAWRIPAAIFVLVFMVWSSATQPFSGNAEFNLRYLDAVQVDKEIGAILMKEFPSSRVVTAWPYTVELQSPQLGYVNRARSAVSVGAEGGISAADERNLGEADLILVSLSPQMSKMAVLRDYALSRNWRLIRRLEKGAAVAELYERPVAEAGERQWEARP